MAGTQPGEEEEEEELEEERGEEQPERRRHAGNGKLCFRVSFLLPKDVRRNTYIRMLILIQVCGCIQCCGYLQWTNEM